MPKKETKKTTAASRIDARPTVKKPKDIVAGLSSASRVVAIETSLRQQKGTLPQIDREKQASALALRGNAKRFHGLKIPLRWFPWWRWRTPCSDKFGYMSSAATRKATKLPFDAATIALVEQLGDFMADATRGPGAASTIPAGFTYFGQFVDHDITLDVDSKLDVEQDATTIPNMRSPAVDLDAVYGQGPAVDAFLYQFPASGPPTAVRLLIGTNQNFGVGGPGGGDGTGPMNVQLNSDLPRAPTTNTALLGDPRNDENLIVSQLHHMMLKFHNKVIDGLVAAGFAGDIFVEAKRLVTHHYQWAVVHDFLRRICGQTAVDAAMASVTAAPGSAFAMPVEFSVAAYRFGHSMIREEYWLNAELRTKPMSDVFAFIRSPLLPVFSNWVVDFNAFFETGFNVAVFNNAHQIDSVLAPALDLLPGFSGMMAILAKRNLIRGMALGLPSGQGMAAQFGVAPLTAAELKQGLPAGEAALLDASGGLLLQKTPLWYYVLREAMVRGGGNQLGPVGARIVAETFVRMLKRDSDSYLNAAAPFTPTLNSAVPGDFTVADLANFSGVTVP
ncbi:MAG: hypothetical protein JNL35_08905 [Sphingopyxis sp.]|nr:hypothetical protein [Sphingopyxis sp.]